MVETFEERPAHATMRGLSWAAVFGGLAVALIVEVLLSMLGIGIGASTIHPSSSSGASAQNVGIGSAVWFVLASIVSLFAGGWVSGRLSRTQYRPDAALHGIVTWSLTSLFTIYLLTTAVGSVISGTTGALGSLFSAVGAGAASVAPEASKAAGDQLTKTGITPSEVTAKAEQLLRETGNPNLSPDALTAQASRAADAAKSSAINPNGASASYNETVYRFLHDTGTASRAKDRRALINVVASEQHITKAQAARSVDAWSQKMDQAQRQTQQFVAQTQQTLKEAGDQTPAAISKAAISGFFLFLIGGIAAALGAMTGARYVVADVRRSEKIDTLSGTIIQEQRSHQTL